MIRTSKRNLKKLQQQPKGCRVSQSFLAGLSIYVFLAEVGFRLPEGDSVFSLYDYLQYLGLPLLLPALLGGWATYKLMQPAHDREWIWRVKVGCLLWSLPILLVMFAIFLTPYGELQGLSLEEARRQTSGISIELAIANRFQAIADWTTQQLEAQAAEREAARATAAAKREAARATATAEHRAAQATAAADAAIRQNDHEQAILAAVNQERIAHGKTRLQWDPRLQAIARAHSQDMAEHNYFEHTNLSGQDYRQRAIAAGYHCPNPVWQGVAENLYFGTIGHQSPDWPARSWMDSPGHRRAMLDPSFNRGAIGIHEGYRSGYGRGHFTTLLLC